MKKLLVAFGILAGFVSLVSLVSAEGDNMTTGGGWSVDIVTGTAWTVSTTRVKLRAIITSSDVTNSVSGNYLLALTTIPNASINGSNAGLFGGTLFESSASVIPAMVYTTTPTIANLGKWSIGDCENCYIEVPALYIRQTVESSGGANRAAIYYKK